MSVREVTGKREAVPEKPEATRAGYRPREVARLYGLAPSTVYAAISAGQLRAFRVGTNGRAVVIPADALEEWLAGAAA